MSSLDVKVAIPKFGQPDFSKTAKELGDVWESVSLVGTVSLNPQDLGQTGSCWFVKDLLVSLDFRLDYFIAKEMDDNIKNAATVEEKNQHRGLLLRIRWHAHQHYEQFVKEITDWQAEIKADLLKILPTDRRTTSLQESEIKNKIGILVSE